MFDCDNKNDRNRKYEITYDYIDVFYFVIVTLLSKKI